MYPKISRPPVDKGTVYCTDNAVSMGVPLRFSGADGTVAGVIVIEFDARL